MYLHEVTALLADVLCLPPSVRRGLTADTALLGNLPELDSMAVVNVITALEERFGIVIADDEIEASLFATAGTLADFVARKRA
jgi:acyl carrier protein